MAAVATALLQVIASGVSTRAEKDNDGAVTVVEDVTVSAVIDILWPTIGEASMLAAQVITGTASTATPETVRLGTTTVMVAVTVGVVSVRAFSSTVGVVTVAVEIAASGYRVGM